MNPSVKKVGSSVGPRGNGRGQRAKDGRTRVLIVDDSRRFRHHMALLLQGEPGLEVVDLASDGAEAVELAARLRPDVVLMDQNMPRKTGAEAAAEHGVACAG